MLRQDKEVTGEKFSSFSGYRKQPLSPSRERERERTAKTKTHEVRLCDSRLFLRSSLGSHRALIVNSLLAILSATRKKAFPLFLLSPLFSSQSYSSFAVLHYVPIFRTSRAKRYITRISCPFTVN